MSSQETFMRAMGLSGWSIGVVVAVSVAMGSAGTDAGEKVQYRYRTGGATTIRGVVIPLPGEQDYAFSARYAGSNGDIVLARCARWEPTAAVSPGGAYVLDRRTNKWYLLNDDFKDEAFDGMSLERLRSEDISPDGKRVVAIRVRYDKRALTEKVEPVQKDLVVVDVATRVERKLMSVEDLKQRLPQDTSREGRAIRVSWLDDRRLYGIVDRDLGSDMVWTCLYTIDAETGEVCLAYCGEDKGSFTEHRIAPGKLAIRNTSLDQGRSLKLVCQRIAEAHEQGRDASPDDMMELNFSKRSGILDLTGKEPRLTLLEKLDAVSKSARRPLGDVLPLSPDGRYLAANMLVNRARVVAILDTATGKALSIEGETASVCDWHPDGKRLLGIMNRRAPADWPSVLVEIPVADILEELAAGGGQ